MLQPRAWTVTAAQGHSPVLDACQVFKGTSSGGTREVQGYRYRRGDEQQARSAPSPELVGSIALLLLPIQQASAAEEAVGEAIGQRGVGLVEAPIRQAGVLVVVGGNPWSHGALQALGTIVVCKDSIGPIHRSCGCELGCSDAKPSVKSIRVMLYEALQTNWSKFA